MKKYLLMMLWAFLPLLSACDDDNDQRLDDRLIGRVWSGDMGFYQDGYALDSSLYFGSDGFGSDELHFVDNGEFLDRLNIRWWVERNDCLCIDYGERDYPRELRNVRVRYRDEISGDLYIGGRYYDRVTLYIQ